MADATPTPAPKPINTTWPIVFMAIAAMVASHWKDIASKVGVKPVAPAVVPKPTVVVTPPVTVVPVVPPAPKPTPTPEPTPTPSGIDPQAVVKVLDLEKKEIGTNVDDAQMFIVSVAESVHAGPISLTVIKSDEKKVSYYAVAEGVACVIREGASATFYCSAVSNAKISQAHVIVTCNHAPQPPPKPVDPPKPPTPSGELRAMIIYESTKNYSADQLSVLNSTALMQAMNDKCTKGHFDIPQWRKWDKDVKTNGEDPVIVSLWNAVLPQAIEFGLPAYVIARGDDVKIMPLPTKAVDAISLLK